MGSVYSNSLWGAINSSGIDDSDGVLGGVGGGVVGGEGIGDSISESLPNISKSSILLLESLI